MKTSQNKDKSALNVMTGQDVRALVASDIMSKWNPEISAAASDDSATINIYDIVGEDWFTLGMTAKTVSAILRKNEGSAITVNINSPGGDFFEGVAIHNLLKSHEGEVTINIVGMAASAASIIAMAGDTVNIAESAFLMIHNAWNCLCGNKNDMRDMAATLEQFDESMAGIYSKQTGIDSAEIAEMMDAETWISGNDSVDRGFATNILNEDDVALDDGEKAKYNSSLKEVDLALAKSGKTRSERRSLLKDLTSMPGATVEKEATPRAGNEKLFNAFTALNETILKHKT